MASTSRRDCELTSKASHPNFSPNTICPPAIYALPPEIILLIVHFHSVDNPPPCLDVRRFEGRASYRALRRLGWIAITHVSSYFRNIVVHDGLLWRAIVFTLGPAWTELMIARAGSQNLVLKTVIPSYFRTYSPATEEMISFISDPSKFHRVSSIYLVGPLHVLRPITDRLSIPAPLLESLTISLPRTAAPGSWLILPEDIAMNAPKLRYVSLHGCGFTWAALRFSALEYLCVTMPNPADFRDAGSLVISHIPTYDDLMDLFALLKHTLRKLILKHCIPRRLASPLDEAIDFHCLEFVQIIGEMNDCLDVLSDIIIPQTATLYLSCNDLKTYIPSMLPLLSFVQSRFAVCAAMGRYPRTISLHPSPYAPFEMSAWDGAYPSSMIHDGCIEHASPFFRLTLSWTKRILSSVSSHVHVSVNGIHSEPFATCPNLDIALTRRILPVVPLDKLRTFAHSLVPHERVHWGITDVLEDVLLRAPCIEDIELFGAAVRAWVPALLRASRSAVDLTSWRPIQILRLTYADLAVRCETREVNGSKTVLDALRWASWKYGSRGDRMAFMMSFIECTGVEDGA